MDMIGKSDIDSSAFSVSILADEQQHNFYYSHFEFLASRGIIPRGWKIESFNYSASSFWAQYTNGNLLTVNANGFYASQRWNMESGEKHDFSGLLVKYISSISPSTFRSAVLGWSVAIPYEDPASWIKKRFFHPDFISENWDFSNTVPSVTVEADDLSISFQFFNRTKMRSDSDGDFDPIINILCQVHHSPFDSDADLTAWLLGWRNHEEAMLSKLMLLAGVRNDS